MNLCVYFLDSFKRHYPWLIISNFIHFVIRCVALYEMHQIQRTKKEGHDIKFGLFLFISFGIGFPIVYLRWRYPVILFVSTLYSNPHIHQSFYLLFIK